MTDGTVIQGWGGGILTHGAVEPWGTGSRNVGISCTLTVIPWGAGKAVAVYSVTQGIGHGTSRAGCRGLGLLGAVIPGWAYPMGWIGL